MLTILFTNFILIFSSNIYSQISPGDLTTAHADLEGISHCTNCHELGEKVYNKNCLNCHKEIKTLIDSNRGYHASGEVKNKNCYACHSEHHGRKFRIINFDSKNFKHSKAGYNLEGAHAKAECNDCHTPMYIADRELQKRAGTFLGLNSNCQTCHEDYHQKTLNSDCESCHNMEKFRPATKFDHNKTKYKLNDNTLMLIV